MGVIRSFKQHSAKAGVRVLAILCLAVMGACTSAEATPTSPRSKGIALQNTQIKTQVPVLDPQLLDSEPMANLGAAFKIVATSEFRIPAGQRQIYIVQGGSIANEAPESQAYCEVTLADISQRSSVLRKGRALSVGDFSHYTANRNSIFYMVDSKIAWVDCFVKGPAPATEFQMTVGDFRQITRGYLDIVRN